MRSGGAGNKRKRMNKTSAGKLYDLGAGPGDDTAHFSKREINMKFDELGITDELVRAVTDLGFETPMPIQRKAIAALLETGTDFIGIARTGTGKTAAFGLPLLQNMEGGPRGPEGVIICPTRELCLQIADDLKSYAKYRRDLKIVPVYGGAGMAAQVRDLGRRPSIIVATPGRLLDLARRGSADLSRIRTVVLDEADEMLKMGFQEDIDAILGLIPENRHIWLFSATMPKSVEAVTSRYLTDPVRISAVGKIPGPETMTHTCHVVREADRYEALRRILDFTPDFFGLVFCRTRRETQRIAEQLLKDGHDAEALHGDLSQDQRNFVMRKFRQGLVRALVATDVAARGIDVDDLTHVIHYHLPDEPDVYTHRSGRTARAGKSGGAIVIANTRDVHRVKNLERTGGISFNMSRLPDGKQIRKRRIEETVARLASEEIRRADLDDYLPAACEALKDLSREDLVRRILSAGAGHILDAYADDRDINVTPRKAKSAASRPGKRGNRTGGRPMQRFFINVGRLDKVNESAIVRLICDESGIRSHLIGDISMNREFSFFDIEKSAAFRVEKAMKNVVLDGRPVRVSQAFRKNASRGGLRRAGGLTAPAPARSASRGKIPHHGFMDRSSGIISKTGRRKQGRRSVAVNFSRGGKGQKIAYPDEPGKGRRRQSV